MCTGIIVRVINYTLLADTKVVKIIVPSLCVEYGRISATARYMASTISPTNAVTGQRGESAKGIVINGCK